MRDPQGKLTPQAFLCTDEVAEPEQIFAWFIRCWQVEVTFEEACAHLGMDTQRYSIVALTARQLAPQDGLMTRHAVWYAKDRPTFSDTIALVRRSLWSEAIYGGSGRCGATLKISHA